MTEHHLKYLLKDTIDARSKWYYIGLCLNLPSTTLDSIREDMDTAKDSYTEVLKHWLKTGEATMQKLIEALEDKTVQEKRLASVLREKYAKRTVLKGIHLINCIYR